MPLIIPDRLPAAGALKDENIFTMNRARAVSQDIRPLKVIIVNLMPTKIATEIQLARVLANSPLQIEMQLVGMDSHKSTHTSQDHLEAFYTTFEEFKDEYFDGMIITWSSWISRRLISGLSCAKSLSLPRLTYTATCSYAGVLRRLCITITEFRSTSLTRRCSESMNIAI